MVEDFHKKLKIEIDDIQSGKVSANDVQSLIQLSQALRVKNAQTATDLLHSLQKKLSPAFFLSIQRLIQLIK